MEILIGIVVVCSIIIMVTNIYRYSCFRGQLKVIMSGENKENRFWEMTAFLILNLFLVGYVAIIVFGHLNRLLSAVLLGASICISLMLTVMFRMIDSVRAGSLEISEVLIGVIEAHDPDLNGHSRYVQNLTMLIYKYLPNSITKDISQVNLKYAALLHDIGKLGISEAVLNKADALNQEEWKIMRLHPKLGFQMLEPLKNFEQVRSWILYHHERMDGTGYYRISGKSIPIGARIISVAETYAAITMRRVYKEPRSYEEAIKELRKCSGTQLDLDIVEVFCKIPKEEVIACIPEAVEIKLEKEVIQID